MSIDIASMSLEEKIGQKIMMDFRYWNQPGQTEQDMTVANDDIKATIIDNHIGGVILFANNLKTRAQIETLGGWFAELQTQRGIKLFIGTDNEGGSVYRFPRQDFPSFPGNMALGAAIEGGADLQLAFEQGKELAQDMRSMHLNVEFAPVVDVNTNPFNPVINVRSFSDDPELVTSLGVQIAKGIAAENIVTTFKHFPGHGDTATDSHTGLPVVHRCREKAFSIDLAPYSRSIANGYPPDMIMTAHIQYPALDPSTVRTRNGADVTVPATMSRAIQTGILRDEFRYDGVTISDALTMMASITSNFTPEQAVEYVFKAGVDIALMPIAVWSSAAMPELAKLIASVVTLVHKGELSEAEIDASVQRIIRLKAEKGLLQKTPNRQAQLTVQRAKGVDKAISDKAITLLANRNGTLPLMSSDKSVFVLALQTEQAAGIKQAFNDQGLHNVTALCQVGPDGRLLANESDIRTSIETCDIFIMGTLTRGFSPAETERPIGDKVIDTDPKLAEGYMRYAKECSKSVIQVSMRAPYDFVYYEDLADAALVTYSFSGYSDGVWNGSALISLVAVLLGKISPMGKLPVNIWKTYNADTEAGIIAYPKGYGLTF